MVVPPAGRFVSKLASLPGCPRTLSRTWSRCPFGASRSYLTATRRISSVHHARKCPRRTLATSPLPQSAYPVEHGESKANIYEDADAGPSIFEEDDVYGGEQPATLHVPEKLRPSNASKEEIEFNVKQAVLRYTDPNIITQLGGPDAWRSVPLDNPDLKFKVLVACNDNCNRRIPDFLLNTVATAGDVAIFLIKNPVDEQERKFIPRVHNFFERLKRDGLMPPNLLFVPAPVIDELNELEKPARDSRYIRGYTDVSVKVLPEARHLPEQDWRAEKPIPDVVDPDAWIDARKLKRRPVPRHWF